MTAPGVMQAGYWSASVDSEDYTGKSNPLDLAIQAGKVRLLRTAMGGYAGRKMWLQIFVPKAFKGPLGVELSSWADWQPSRQAQKPPKADTTEPLIVQVYDKAAKNVSDAGESLKTWAQGLGAGVGILLLIFLISKKGK